MGIYEWRISPSLQEGGKHFSSLSIDRHDHSCSPSKLNIPRTGSFVSEFSQCMCFNI